MPKIQEVKGQHLIYLPKAIVNAKKWKKGTELDIEFDAKGNLVLKEKE
tara:strand:+ start:407 stop:550 length:144 start_codon:yes stop_codon:yes gene_type:complete